MLGHKPIQSQQGFRRLLREEKSAAAQIVGGKLAGRQLLHLLDLRDRLLPLLMLNIQIRQPEMHLGIFWMIPAFLQLLFDAPTERAVREGQ